MPIDWKALARTNQGDVIQALRADLDRMAQTLEPFCRPGGGPELQAFCDLNEDVVVWKNSGEAVTAGDVRRAREAFAKYKGVPVSMMHFRRPYVEPEYAALEADLKAVVVAAKDMLPYWIDDDHEPPAHTRLRNALARPGVKAFLEGEEDG